MSKSNWFYKPEPIQEEIQDLVSALNVDYSIAYLLAQRGINSYEKAKNFFRPLLEDLHSPFQMKGMKEAVNRILKAIEAQEKICIYGDYDVDGTTSVALMFDFLRPFINHISTYIPDRETEGYGISYLGIDKAYDKGASLIIALDCGIKDAKKVDYAKEKNIEVIICDHHLPGDKIPHAVAILDPKQTDCNYPFKELSGCGIGFKLIEALAKELNLPKNRVFKYLDLVALSIAADIVPIIGENRILAFHGLLKLNKNPSIGLGVMTREIKKEITISELVFGVAPKINAAGRIKHAKVALKLLLAKDEFEAQVAFQEISQLNVFRKNLDQKSTTEALELIKSKGEEKKYTSVLYQPHWHRGIVGIMASRLIENYYRPTIIFTQAKDKLVGSARSIEGFDIYKALEKCAEYIEQFGGHKYAAGMTIEIKNFSFFKEKFEKVAIQMLEGNELIPPIKIDYKLDFDQITPRFLRILKQFEPFGPGNMRPVFYSSDLFTKENHIKVYKSLDKSSHFKIKVSQKEKEASFSCLGFNMGKLAESLKKKPFKMVFSIKENCWNGQTSFELYAKDLLLV